ncbi:hypothetical protein PITC_089830 [Penicillium italicum]|uniref:Uncharacterized protein n=1 Tax=Penicillium italicum TaxID=40296 RepID=A0A0A2LA09_PENIT|nr:hypothetical protein PITC_089830 [Penicillium italicum]
MWGVVLQGQEFDFSMDRDHVVTAAVEIMRLTTWRV